MTKRIPLIQLSKSDFQLFNKQTKTKGKLKGVEKQLSGIIIDKFFFSPRVMATNQAKSDFQVMCFSSTRYLKSHCIVGFSTFFTQAKKMLSIFVSILRSGKLVENQTTTTKKSSNLQFGRASRRTIETCLVHTSTFSRPKFK